MKRDETKAQKESRLNAFERDERPTKKASDNNFNWQLQNVDHIDWTSDNSGVYCLIYWQVKTNTVRIDFLSSDNNDPIISFAGESDNVRKAVGIWIDSRISQKTSDKFSAAHIAYIGSELQKADIFRIDYIQDDIIKLSDLITSDSVASDNDRARIAQNESYRSDKVCSKCGYSKCGYSSDNILMCLDCGEAWPTSDNVELTDDKLLDKVTSDNKAAAKIVEEKYS